MIRLLPVLLLSGCASYGVVCGPDGGKSIEVKSTRSVNGLAAQITEGCGITVVVDEATGSGEIITSIAAGVAR